eukprot:TRINITY_DN11473_c0_g1_i2.p2 TRINITY_DN11473_c0_g1~~TRINITY_DN11473_c0_g1_i2.p2  ORF type:complete len:120 (-),score=43.58 TRINITY_DN11473_c0_g1_i2:341-700(-)
MASAVLAGLGLGIGALGARTALRTAQRAGVKVEMPQMPNLSGFSLDKLRVDSLKGFESPMSRGEAKKILNISSMSPGKDAIREQHRKLLVANHPDKGGSTYIATKINEAKDILLGKKMD